MNLGTRPCKNCGKLLELKITRDITRKNFCSHSCRALFASKTFTKDHMQKMWNAGCTPESHLKKSHKGENHPKYIKDRSKLKGRPRYEQTNWRIAIFKRDNYTCQFCGQRGGRLQADHILPYSTHPEQRWNLENGRTLCLECHKKTDTYGSGALKYKKVGG